MKVRAIDFVVMNVSDLERSMAFYRDTLGMDVPLTEESQSWLRWKEFDTPPVALALRLDEQWPGVNAVVGLAVEDARAAVQELRRKGVKILIDVGETPVCYEALIEDSDGSLLLIHQWKDGTAG